MEPPTQHLFIKHQVLCQNSHLFTQKICQKLLALHLFALDWSSNFMISHNMCVCTTTLLAHLWIHCGLVFERERTCAHIEVCGSVTWMPSSCFLLGFFFSFIEIKNATFFVAASNQWTAGAAMVVTSRFRGFWNHKRRQKARQILRHSHSWLWKEHRKRAATKPSNEFVHNGSSASWQVLWAQTQGKFVDLPVYKMSIVMSFCVSTEDYFLLESLPHCFKCPHNCTEQIFVCHSSACIVLVCALVGYILDHLSVNYECKSACSLEDICW